MLDWAKRVAAVVAFAAGILPLAVRRAILRALLLIESRIGAPDAALKRLFAIEDDIKRLISERATAYGGGINPKHRLTRYHDFFVDRILPNQRVLDLGCGIGEVARSIASRVPGARVVGVDMDEKVLARAREIDNPPGLVFEKGDATSGIPVGPWDVVVLSNVLEHIERRVEFLRQLVAMASPGLLLLRVPLFERDWQMALRRELGVDFRSDPTHFIEPTLAEFQAEMDAAGLEVTEKITVWGEIWAAAKVKQ
ncbi:MAG: methyltransferase domain-containing protein [Alphaproteobacteria bacterium]|nr:methyltransferase domain-containing protein [Alphaproteobacteria bacterium]